MGIVGLVGSRIKWTTGLSAPGGLVGKDRRCEALSVRFTTNGEADASEGGGGGGEVGGEAMILFDKLC